VLTLKAVPKKDAVIRFKKYCHCFYDKRALHVASNAIEVSSSLVKEKIVIGILLLVFFISQT